MFVQWPIEWHCPVGHPLRPPFAGRPPSTATARSPARPSPVRPPVHLRLPAVRPPARLGQHGLSSVSMASAGLDSTSQPRPARGRACDMRVGSCAVSVGQLHARGTITPGSRAAGASGGRKATHGQQACEAGVRAQLGWAHLRVRPLKNDDCGSLSTSGPLCVDNLRACTGGTRG